MNFDLKAKIKETPISTIIGSYISLNKRGRRSMGLCPFHDDSRPSLSVDDNKNMFMCFVCQTGGDVFTFVEKYKNLDFKGALKELAGFLNLPYEEYRPRKLSPKEEKTLKLLDYVAKFYQNLAQTKYSSPFSLFLKKRGLSSQTAETFSLGFAPAQDYIGQYLTKISDQTKRKIAVDLALETGLIWRDRFGGIRDTFRERIIFPIRDMEGAVVGFGGRLLGDGKQVKYLNSRESFIFNKKKLCYGFNFAKNFIKKKDAVILVEGYMDMISLYQNGFEHSVALMGVGMSDYSLCILKSLTEHFYLGMDGDEAGFKANARIDDLCLKRGIIPLFLDYSPHKDPDEFLVQEGSAVLCERMASASAFIDLRLNQAFPQKIPALPDQKLAVLRKLFALITPLGDKMTATERLVGLAERLGLKSDKDTIIAEYREYLKKNTKKAFRIEIKKEGVATLSSKNTFKLARTDQILLKELILCPNLLIHEKILKILDFSGNNEVQLILSSIKDFYCDIDCNAYPSFVLEALNKGGYSLKLKEIIGGLLFGYRPVDITEKKMDQLMADLKKRLRMEQLKEKRAKLGEDRARCENEQGENSLIRELHAIDKQMELIKGSFS